MEETDLALFSKAILIQDSPKRVTREDLFCPNCQSAHADKGRWAVREHQTHLCLYCGIEFEGTCKAVSFPLYPDIPQRYPCHWNPGQTLPKNVKPVTRGTPWGNLFVLKEHGGSYTLGDSLKAYKQWLDLQLRRDPQFLDPLIRYEFIACHCRQGSPCHVDLIIAAMTQMYDELLGND